MGKVRASKDEKQKELSCLISLDSAFNNFKMFLPCQTLCSVLRIRCLFIYLYFVLAMLLGMWDLSSPTRV